MLAPLLIQHPRRTNVRLICRMFRNIDSPKGHVRRSEGDCFAGAPGRRRALRTLRGHTRPIGRIAWSPDGRMLASPSQDATVRIWDAETGECMRVIDGHKDKVWDLAYDPSGSMLASASEDRSVKLWEPEREGMLRALKEHNDGVWAVAFNPKGGILASAGADQTVKLYGKPAVASRVDR